MLVSRCCNARLEVDGHGADAYYVCGKCGKATDARFVLDGLFTSKELSDAKV